MTFLDIQNAVINISNVQQQPTLVKQSINIALLRAAGYFEWPFYMVNTGVINTVAPYSTGTVTTVPGSAVIVGVGTVWTSDMVGRKIRVGNGQPYYRIKSIDSTTTMTLVTPFQNDTVTAGTYTIYKDEYRLASDVDTYNTMIQLQNAIAMFSTPPDRFDKFFPSPYSYSDPTLEIMEGTTLDVYTTGTVTATVNSMTLVGVGTGWASVPGLGRMSKITVGSANQIVYTIKRVIDDTHLEVYETPSTTQSAVTYSISMNNLMVQVYPIPAMQENLYYRYRRIPTPLVNNYDEPDLPNQWHWLLIYGSLSFIFLEKGDISKSQEQSEARFLQGLQQMKSKLGSYASARKWLVSSQDTYIRTGDGLEKSTFDRRFSAP